MVKKISSLLLIISILLATAPTAMAIGDIFSTISGGSSHTTAITSSGSLWTWGENFTGQLGNGTVAAKYEPTKIMDGAIAVSAGTSHTTAITSDGSLWAWGWNLDGQLGDGTTANRLTPTKIMDGAIAVSAGASHTTAITSDGSLWTWGYNQYGQLGDGTTVNKLTPTKIMDDVIAVSASLGHTTAITSDGSLWAWGWNREGLLGDGTTVNKLKPTKIMGGVIAVSAGYYHTTAITADGSLWTWGSNRYGLLGDDSNEPKLTPTKIMNDVVAVSAGYHYTTVITSDGSLWAWGYNQYGQLGIKEVWTIQYKLTPTKIMDNVIAVSASESHVTAIASDGSLWAWGQNGARLGDGGTANKRTPVKIMDGVRLPSTSITSTPIAPTVLINGKSITFDAYNINDNNYFKLRDIAYILSGTGKQFSVDWIASSNAISLTSGKPYTAVGGEMESGGTEAKIPTQTDSKIMLDGKEVSFTAYNIDGNNYFKLHDIGKALDFAVDWDGAQNTIVIDTSKGYTE